MKYLHLLTYFTWDILNISTVKYSSHGTIEISQPVKIATHEISSPVKHAINKLTSLPS